MLRARPKSATKTGASREERGSKGGRPGGEKNRRIREKRKFSKRPCNIGGEGGRKTTAKRDNFVDRVKGEIARIAKEGKKERFHEGRRGLAEEVQVLGGKKDVGRGKASITRRKGQ